MESDSGPAKALFAVSGPIIFPPGREIFSLCFDIWDLRLPVDVWWRWYITSPPPVSLSLPPLPLAKLHTTLESLINQQTGNCTVNLGYRQSLHHPPILATDKIYQLCNIDRKSLQTLQSAYTFSNILCSRHRKSLPNFAIDWDKFYQSLLQTEDRTIFPSFQCGSKVKVSIDNWELQWRDIINLLLVTGPGEMRVCWLLTPYQLYKQGWASWVVFRVYTHISMFWLVLTVFCLSDWLCLTHSLTVLELFAGRLMIFSQRDVTG